ncbi:MAG: flagellar hook-length control protein FliK [Desulfobacterales bacterium]|nr:MAG: flagellar hook-length control protein FliK [Desulfobacterales bacterium]
MDETLNPTAVQNEGELELALLQENTASAESDQLLSIRGFMNFIKALEEMGYHLSVEGSDGPNPVAAESTGSKDVAALKILMARPQQNELVSSNELEVAFKRLEQFIAGILKGTTQAAVGGNTAIGQALNQVPNSALILQWIQQLTSGLHPQGNDAGMSVGEGDSGAKPSGSSVTDASSFPGSAGNSIKGTGNLEGSGPFQSTENAGLTSQPENRATIEPAKKVSENLPSQTQINENRREAIAVEKADADTPRPKEDAAFLRETKTVSRVDDSSQMPAGQNRMLANKTDTVPDNRSVKQSAPSELKIESANLSNGSNRTTADQESLSKVLQETRSQKDGNVKMSGGMSGETGGKVIKTEGGANDPGLLNPQNHQIEKTADPLSLSKAIESERSGLRTQTLDQIVQKAAMHLKNGQHEARIDLKPEFLGHIRMQVISENHQVTVRIMAEHGFVKDMIENNLHQLKANLQQQGLDIEKLEVSVSRDSDESGTPKERRAGMRARHGATDNGNQRHFEQDTPQDNRQPRRSPKSATGVDYFA